MHATSVGTEQHHYRSWKLKNEYDLALALKGVFMIMFGVKGGW